MRGGEGGGNYDSEYFGGVEDGEQVGRYGGRYTRVRYSGGGGPRRYEGAFRFFRMADPFVHRCDGDGDVCRVVICNGWGLLCGEETVRFRIWEWEDGVR